MTKNSTKDKPFQKFEDIKLLSEEHGEYWSARDLMVALGYGENWDNFEGVIKKAIDSTSNSNLTIDINVAFRKATKSYIGKNRYGEFTGQKPDYHLSRFACYLIAQNGDVSKPQIANAQSYFAIQTYRQEQIDKLTDTERRLYIRSQVTDENKKLFESAQNSGVSRFGTFYDAGYIGLYGMSARKIRKHKNLGKDDILDRAGTTELAANLFRITQTQEKLQKNINDGKIVGEDMASKTHFMVGGKVRQTIKDIQGTLPEDLAPEENVKGLNKLADDAKKAIKEPKGRPKK